MHSYILYAYVHLCAYMKIKYGVFDLEDSINNILIMKILKWIKLLLSQRSIAYPWNFF